MWCCVVVQVRNIVEAGCQRDMRDASVFESYTLPKLYMKMQYCISCGKNSQKYSIFDFDIERSGKGMGLMSLTFENVWQPSMRVWCA